MSVYTAGSPDMRGGGPSQPPHPSARLDPAQGLCRDPPDHLHPRPVLQQHQGQFAAGKIMAALKDGKYEDAA